MYSNVLEMKFTSAFRYLLIHVAGPKDSSLLSFQSCASVRTLFYGQASARVYVRTHERACVRACVRAWYACAYTCAH